MDSFLLSTRIRHLERTLEKSKRKEEKEARELEAMVLQVEENLQLMTVSLGRCGNQPSPVNLGKVVAEPVSFWGSESYGCFSHPPARINRIRESSALCVPLFSFSPGVKNCVSCFPAAPQINFSLLSVPETGRESRKQCHKAEAGKHAASGI